MVGFIGITVITDLKEMVAVDSLFVAIIIDTFLIYTYNIL
jgi:hypothetical protein